MIPPMRFKGKVREAGSLGGDQQWRWKSGTLLGALITVGLWGPGLDTRLMWWPVGRSVCVGSLVALNVPPHTYNSFSRCHLERSCAPPVCSMTCSFSSLWFIHYCYSPCFGQGNENQPNQFTFNLIMNYYSFILLRGETQQCSDIKMYSRPPVLAHSVESISVLFQNRGYFLSPLAPERLTMSLWRLTGNCWRRRHSGHRSQRQNPEIYCLLLLVIQNRFINVIYHDS